MYLEELTDNMNKKFSKSWVSSKQPRKQRKYRANAPLHIKAKFMHVNLSKALRKSQGIRNIQLRKGDKVKIMRGKFKKKEGKVNEILLNRGKIYIEGIQTKKKDGSNIKFPIRASNLQIVELNMEDKKRIKSAGKKKSAEAKEGKKETKPETKRENQTKGET